MCYDQLQPKYDLEDALEKAAALSELVAKRRRETHEEYHHLHSFDLGRWDFEYVVPWTKSAFNLETELMVIGQDWSSEQFTKARYRRKPISSRAKRPRCMAANQ